MKGKFSGQCLPIAMMAVLGAGSLTSLNVHGAAGYASGLSTGCNICDAAVTSAFASIVTSVETSTQAIGYTTGMPPFVPSPIPGLGFPGLSDTLNASLAKNAKGVVSAFDSSTKRLASEIRKIPVNQSIQDTAMRDSAFIAAGDKQNCATVAYGRAMTQRTETSLGAGWKWAMEGGREPVDPDDMTSDEAIARISVDIENQGTQRINRDFGELKALAEANGQSDATIIRILNPAILVSDHKKTLNPDPDQDEFGLSDHERMDYLIRYLTIDTPSQSEALLNAATTPGAINESTSLTLKDMRSGMVMAVTDNVMNSRRSNASSFGTSYLAEAMLEPFDPDAASSNEEFVYRVANYRQRDSDIIARIVIDEGSALREYSKMEAEQMAIKYQRWRYKRQTNLMLAQVLATQLQNERE